MMNLKEFLSNKSNGYYLRCISAVAMLFTLIFTVATGVSYGDLTSAIVIVLALGLLVQAVTLYKDFYSVGSIVSTVLTGVGIMMLLDGRLNKIGLILSGVVTEKIPALFIVACIFAILAMLLNCVAGFMGTEKTSEPVKE